MTLEHKKHSNDGQSMKKSQLWVFWKLLCGGYLFFLIPPNLLHIVLVKLIFTWEVLLHHWIKSETQRSGQAGSKHMTCSTHARLRFLELEERENTSKTKYWSPREGKPVHHIPFWGPMEWPMPAFPAWFSLFPPILCTPFHLPINSFCICQLE